MIHHAYFCARILSYLFCIRFVAMLCLSPFHLSSPLLHVKRHHVTVVTALLTSSSHCRFLSIITFAYARLFRLNQLAHSLIRIHPLTFVDQHSLIRRICLVCGAVLRRAPPRSWSGMYFSVKNSGFRSPPFPVLTVKRTSHGINVSPSKNPAISIFSALL